MSLWWLQDGWTAIRCANCGGKIWPEGDPDTGLCYPCWNAQMERQAMEQQMAEQERDAINAAYEAERWRELDRDEARKQHGEGK